MSLTRILVQMADEKWTTAALTVALEKAQPGGEIALVEFLPADALNWHGLDCDEYEFSESEREEIQKFQAMAQAAGVKLTTHCYKTDSLEKTIVRAADTLDADAVFATVPHSALPFLHDRPIKHLSHVLEAHHHHLFTVDQPAVTSGWTPEAREVEE
jgi:hypothetical protein